MKVYNFFRKMLPIMATILFCCAVMPHLWSQSKYSVYNSTAGSPIGSYPTLNIAVANCVLGDSCIITALDNDTLKANVEILAGYKIALKSDAGHTYTILNEDGYEISVNGSSVTLENIILKGMSNIYGDLGSLIPIVNGTLILNDDAVIQNSPGLELHSSSVLIMNGGRINDCKHAVLIYENSTFIMYRGKISGCFGEASGVTIYNGIFEMYDGLISGNTGTANAGVYVYDEFNMYGGEVSNNISFGGAVMVDGGVFTMNGTSAIISDNKCLLGGGVSIISGTFNMYDGKISNNKAEYYTTSEFDLMYRANETIDEGDMLVYMNFYFSLLGTELPNGGGVGVIAGEFNMYGGSITDNTAVGDGGGIYTMDYDYENPMNAYKNILITYKDSVYNNTAGQGYTAPSKPAGWDTEHHFDISLLTNDQINYRPTPPTLDTICFTDSVTLAVTVKDGGKNPVYQWFRNGVAVDDSNDSIFKYKSSGRDTILCKVYPDTACGNEVYSKIMVIEMLDSLALDQPENIDICAGKTIENIVFSGTYDYVRWEVTTGNGLTIGMPANSGTGDIGSFTTTNSGVITITATPVSGKCEGVSKTFTITVNPKTKPKATIRIK